MSTTFKIVLAILIASVISALATKYFIKSSGKKEGAKNESELDLLSDFNI